MNMFACSLRSDESLLLQYKILYLRKDVQATSFIKQSFPFYGKEKNVHDQCEINREKETRRVSFTLFSPNSTQAQTINA